MIKQKKGQEQNNKLKIGTSFACRAVSFVSLVNPNENGRTLFDPTTIMRVDDDST